MYGGRHKRYDYWLLMEKKSLTQFYFNSRFILVTIQLYVSVVAFALILVVSVSVR